ncbi:MAG: thioredoxin domain-containing protein [Anaerolineae bacterium]|nr:thioredoxin domain-containing protein [Anaerolineae bacterium]
MPTRTKYPEESIPQGMPWPARVTYPVGKMRRQRQQQFRQQMIVLIAMLTVTLVVGAIVVLANWNNAGSVEKIACEAYPDYCVPFEGASATYAGLEAAASRELDAPSEGAAGVVRYVGELNEPRIGDPAAPIHFVVVSDFACSHCQGFHMTTLPRFMQDYVLTGKATFGLALTTWTGGEFSKLASQAAYCAGEQGGFWEFSDELFHAAQSESIGSAFSLKGLRNRALDMDLDADELDSCVASSRYALLLNENENFAYDTGVTGTPTVLVNYGSGWQALGDRSYDMLAQLTEAANAE